MQRESQRGWGWEGKTSRGVQVVYQVSTAVEVGLPPRKSLSVTLPIDGPQSICKGHRTVSDYPVLLFVSISISLVTISREKKMTKTMDYPHK